MRSEVDCSICEHRHVCKYKETEEEEWIAVCSFYRPESVKLMLKMIQKKEA